MLLVNTNAINIRIISKNLGSMTGVVNKDFKLQSLIGKIRNNTEIEFWRENSLQKRRKVLFTDGIFTAVSD